MRYSSEQIEKTILSLLAQDNSFRNLKTGIAKQAALTMVAFDPIAPLTLPQGRQLFLADAVGNLLSSYGYKVKRQCCVRNKSEALQTFIVSVYLRYLELCGDDVPFPLSAYHGDYIFDFAASVHRQYGDKFRLISKPLLSSVGDETNSITAFYLHMMRELGVENIQIIADIGVQSIIDNVQKEIKELNIDCDQWFYQHQYSESATTEILTSLKQNSLWQPQQGQTGFLLDLDYLRQQLEAKHDLVIVFCDNKQCKAFNLMAQKLQQLGYDIEPLRLITVGEVEVLEGEESLATSPLSAEFISLREARQEIASDRLRYQCLAAHSNDAVSVSLADENKANDLEAVRTTYSKINLQLNEKQHRLDAIEIKNSIDLLSHCNDADPQHRLLQWMCKYPEVLCRAKKQLDTSGICSYLLELVNWCERDYNQERVKNLNIQEQNAEVVLLFAAQKVLTDALQILSLPFVDHK